MWSPSKDPDHYLLGQPGHPRPGARRPVPARLSFLALFAGWVLVTLLAWALGADWSRAVLPYGLCGGAITQFAVGVWWRATGRARPA